MQNDPFKHHTLNYCIIINDAITCRFYFIVGLVGLLYIRLGCITLIIHANSLLDVYFVLKIEI